MMADSPDLAAAKRLLDSAKAAGFAFERIAPGEDSPMQIDTIRAPRVAAARSSA